jgi:hypothetical protein
MNTIITPDSTTSNPISILGIESAPVEVKLRMTPEEIREFVAKARAADEERKRATIIPSKNIRTTPVESQAHPGDSIRQ